MTHSNQSEAQGLALNVQGDTAPEWVQLLPAGPSVTGRDGRAWRMEDPEAIVTAFNTYGADLPVDFEHATQVKGDKGEHAPAVGWIKGLEARNREIWGKIDWLDTGRDAVVSRAYRYVSPVFGYTKAAGNILGIKSAGLTNLPNLQLTALNKQGDPEDQSMDKALLEALGLAEGASSDDALTAINKLKSDEATARNRAENPDASSLVPRADYDLAMNRIRTFEDGEKTRQDEAITAAIDAAVEAGKIAPASRDYHTASCRAEGGLERFKALVDASAELAPKANLDPAKIALNKGTLSAEEVAICRQMGITKEEFLAEKNAEEL